MAVSVNNSRTFMFVKFCELCEEISRAVRIKKGEVLKKFISKYRQKYDDNFYSVLRLLLPNLDRERGAFGVKEHSLAKLYIRILCIDKESKDARRLINFRSPKNNGSSVGDFAEVAFVVLSSRCSAGKQLTVEDVNAHLNNIALKNAENNSNAVKNEFNAIVQRMSAMEQKWFIRIVLKDMKLGVGHIKILSVFHPDAKELYDVSNSLIKVCSKLKDPNVRLHEIEITLFEPFRPMLAERCDVQNIEQHFVKHPGKRYVETKLDGERSQLHYSEGKFKYISRNGFDFTEQFGGTSVTGSLSPYLIKQFKSHVKSCILDGEMMPWNTRYNSFGNKGMNIDVKFLRVGNVHQPCLCVFDVLYFNGRVLTNKPLSERLAILEDIFTPLEGIIMHTSRKEANTGEDVLAALNDAIDNREEGIIVKDPISIYKPNARKEGWIKIKPEYTPGAMVELDLLIIGGYYGEGRKRGIVSHFLLGVAVPPQTQGDNPVEFESISRVGSGCTMEELAELGKKLDRFWKKLYPGQCPQGLKWTKEKPELWIEPQNSVILQVKASEVTQSDEYQTGCTLRFPRIEKVRYDKPWSDCLTTVEFFKLKEDSSGKLCSAHITQMSPKTRKRKVVQPTKALGEQFCNFGLSRVKRLTKVFSNKEICILTGYKDLTKQQIEIKVAENGGAIAQNPGSETFCVVAGNENNIRVQNVCKLNSFDVVKADWLINCLDAYELLPWTPADMISKCQATAEKLALLYDEYDDSYTQPATEQSLKWSLQRVIKLNGHKLMTPKEMADFDKVLFKGPSPYSIFRQCVAYFVDTAKEKVGDTNNIHSLLMISILNFKMQGGNVVDQINSETTHVVLLKSDLSRLEEIKEIKQKENLNFYIVNHFWILQSYESKKKMEENYYIM